MAKVKLLDPFDPKRRLDRYELIGELATGGMATVYLARLAGAGGFQRFVAIKRLHPHLASEEEFTSMFLDEARLAAGIHHPHVVPILEVGQSDSVYFLVMEYIEGDTLARLVARALSAGKPVPRAILIRIVLDTLAGLHAAHELTDDAGHLVELVHRDCSPQNILVGVDGSSRITDFGVARASSRLSFTRSDRLKGKLAYMSPEQAQSDLTIDRRSDVFGMGIILWEVLAGRRLFKADTEAGTMRRVLIDPIARLSTVMPGIPPAVDAICAKALERDLTLRFQTAAEMADVLERTARMSASASDPGVASPRDVAAYMQSVIGRDMAAQRESVRAWLSQSESSLPAAVPARVNPLDMNVKASGDDPSWSAVMPPPPPLDALVSPPHRAPPAPGVELRPAAAGGEVAAAPRKPLHNKTLPGVGLGAISPFSGARPPAPTPAPPHPLESIEEPDSEDDQSETVLMEGLPAGLIAAEKVIVALPPEGRAASPELGERGQEADDENETLLMSRTAIPHLFGASATKTRVGRGPAPSEEDENSNSSERDKADSGGDDVPESARRGGRSADLLEPAPIFSAPSLQARAQAGRVVQVLLLTVGVLVVVVGVVVWTRLQKSPSSEDDTLPLPPPARSALSAAPPATAAPALPSLLPSGTTASPMAPSASAASSAAPSASSAPSATLSASAAPSGKPAAEHPAPSTSASASAAPQKAAPLEGKPLTRPPRPIPAKPPADDDQSNPYR